LPFDFDVLDANHREAEHSPIEFGRSRDGVP
jgi:hypothetical protein